jgi:hypothetical protein
MGYYVTLEGNNAYIRKDKLDEAYKILCELNNHNELKRGGCGIFEDRQKIEGPHEDIWFSWMEWNYPETCADAAAILGQLGFELEEDGNGGISFLFYDNKTGSEDVFIAALAPVLSSDDESAPWFEWRGEDGAHWRQIVSDGVMKVQQPQVTWID